MTTAPDKYLSAACHSTSRIGRNLKAVPINFGRKPGNCSSLSDLRLNTARVVAMTMTTETEVLSNVWWPIKTKRRSVWDKAVLALWHQLFSIGHARLYLGAFVTLAQGRIG